MHNLSQTLLDAFRKLPVAVTIAVMMFAPASHVSLAEAPEALPGVAAEPASDDDFYFEDLTKKELKIEAAKIDAYFTKKNMPLAGYGMDFVLAAKANNIPSKFMAAISVIETTGGRHTCKNPEAQNNLFGYGSCQDGYGYSSFTESINRVSAHVGGNVEKTAKYYRNQNKRAVLKKYNSVIPTYAQKIEAVMAEMEAQEVSAEDIS